MRVDRFLDAICVIKTRSAAAKAIDAGRVLVDGVPAKRSLLVRPGMRIDILDPRCPIHLEVLDVPVGAVSKRDARTLYRALNESGSDVASE